MSGERVRQIGLGKLTKRCVKHNRNYFNSCSYCLLNKSYPKLLQALTYSELIDEAKLQSKSTNRNGLEVEMRAILVKVLKEKYEKSFSEIGSLLNKDRTTVKYLYENRRKGR